jgi:hypothetical protein
MSIFGNLLKRGEGYLLSIGIKRAGAAILGLILGQLANAKVSAILTTLGISVDPAQVTVWFDGVMISLSVLIHDWLKVKLNSPRA